MKRFIVIGLSSFGVAVAETLATQEHEVVVIDGDPARIDAIGPKVERAVVGDATQVAVLERAGCKGADAAIVGVGDDITASILATLALKDLGVPAIHVKVVSAEHARVMERQGVTETIFPERESGEALGHRLSSTGILQYIPIAPGFSIQEMAVPERWHGTSLRTLNLRQEHRTQVIAVHDHLRDEYIGVPDPDRPLTESDTLLVSGRPEDLARLSRIR